VGEEGASNRRRALGEGGHVELRHGDAEVTEGVHLHYVESAPPGAAPGGLPLIVLLHGFPQFWYLWRAQLEELGRDHRTVAPDMRGYNLSSKPPDVEAYRMRHLVADVLGLADHFGARRFTLVGHDWGGIVAWALAAAHPQRLDRLVIIDGPPPFTWGRELEQSERQREAVRYMVDLSQPSPGPEELLTANDFAALDTLALEAGILRGYLDDDDRARYHEAWSRPGALTGGLNYYRAAGVGEQVQHGQPAQLRQRMESLRIDVPTLVIWGEKDRFLLPSLTRGLERWVPDVRVEVLPGAGHWVPQERSTEVTRLIREFRARP
jgi:epoxide hydrolase 4